MAGAYAQFRWRCIQKVVAGLAIGLAGLALILGDVGLGTIALPQSRWAGALIAAAGVLYSTAAVVALRKRRRPLVCA